MTKMGKVIADGLARKNMSVDDLQRETLIDRSQLYRYLKCQVNPTLGSAVKICKVLGITLDELAEALEV